MTCISIEVQSEGNNEAEESGQSRTGLSNFNTYLLDNSACCRMASVDVSTVVQIPKLLTTEYHFTISEALICPQFHLNLDFKLTEYCHCKEFS